MRRELSLGIESEVGELRRLKPAKRSAEVLTFVAFWVVGLVLIHHSKESTALSYAVGALFCVVALNAFVLLLHEGMHNTLVGHPSGNDLLAVLLGSTVGISYTAYKIMHLRHHDFLGEASDPDDYNNYTNSRRIVWMLHGMRLAVGSLLYLIMIPHQAWKYATLQERSRLCAEYAFLLALYGSLWAHFSPAQLAFYHGIPILIVGWLVNMRGFTQHGLAVSEDPLLASRSIHAHPVVRFLLLNENYHLEHHLFPEIPSYHLHHLHNLLWPRLPRAVKNDSYSEFLLASLKAAPKLDETPIGVVRLHNENPTPGRGEL